MTKIRVYEVAKQLGVDENTALNLLTESGASVKNRLSAVENDIFERVKRKVEQMKSPQPVIEEKVSGGKVIRRKKPAVPADEAKPAETNGRHESPSAEKIAAAPVASHVETPAPEVHKSAPKVKAADPAHPVKTKTAEAKSSDGHSAKSSSHLKAAPVVEAKPETPAPVEASEAKPVEAPKEEVKVEAAKPVEAPKEEVKVEAAKPVEETPKAVKPVEPKVEAPATKPVEVSKPVVEAAPPPPVAAVPVAAPPVEKKVEPVSPKHAESAAHAASAKAAEHASAVLRRPGLAERTRLEAAAKPAPEPAPVVAPVSEPVEEVAAPVDNGAPVVAAVEAPRPVEPPVRKTGIETWTGRPGVPMPQNKMRSVPPPPQRRAGVQVDTRNTMQSRPGDSRGGMQRPAGSTDTRPSYGDANRGGMGMGGGMGGGQNRMGRGGSMGGRGRPGMNSIPSGIKRASLPPPSEMSAHKKVIKIDEKVTLATLAQKMSLKATDVLMKLMQMGMTGVNINSSLDADTAKLLASEFGWEVSDVAVSEESAIRELRGDAEENPMFLEPRPPVVTVMGHVDHGKTSLLDYIRKAQVAAGEAGGITQHVGAYKVQTSKGPVTFLDTPGHEAFTAMRARGASITDIVILVVAADDGVMPQTREAANHARAAKVPIVVAVNKIDKPEADPSRVRRELMEINLIPEDLGGDTLFVEVSAKTGRGVDELLETVALQAEMLELKANRRKPGTGTVVEAMLDRGKGPIARVLVRDGVISVGDIILAGPAWGKIRAMTDEHGRPVQKAGPSVPVEILGLSDVPGAGDIVDVVKDPRKAQEFAEARSAKQRKNLLPSQSKVSLEDIVNRASESEHLELRLIIKADVQGSVEAVTDALSRLSTEKVKVAVVHSAVGGITEGDVNLAVAIKGIIIGFNVRPAGKASSLADTEGIEIRLYNIIYNAVDDVKKAMAGLLAPTIVEKFIGRAVVRQIFPISKVGVVAGSMVSDGTIKRSANKVRLVRDSIVVWEGKIGGLRHLKEDKREVEKGFECGIALEGYGDVKPGDHIECYDVEEVAATL